MSIQSPAPAAAEKARLIRDRIPDGGLFADKEWRISPDALAIGSELHGELEWLGPRLAAFYRALEKLHRESLEGGAPAWVSDWLGRGKPRSLLDWAWHPRFRGDLPRIIRPDILLTEDGWKITELDSVPGGTGLTAWLQRVYGRNETILEDFSRTFRSAAGATAIVISEESAVYRPEMEWLAGQIRSSGPGGGWLACRPEDLEYRPEGVFCSGVKIGLVYRFFELFDLPNLKSIDRLLEKAAGGQVEISPPVKTAPEEKMALAFFWAGELADFWKRELGEESFAALRRHIPPTWLIDPAKPPPVAADWNEVKRFSQKKRRMVVKLSGFSPLAWGGRSVRIGHDLPTTDWGLVIDHALEAAGRSPSILQPFEKPRRVEASWFDFERQELIPMQARVRLCPFYFAGNGDNASAGGAKLSGILATLCPPDKKIIHGMRDAVMTLAV